MGVWAALAAAYDDKNAVALDPVRWLRENAHIRLWAAQRAIARSLVKNRYTAVHACFDSGKSFGAAAFAVWWIEAHPIGQAFVITTAPTSAQVRTILWQNIGKIHDAAGSPGRINRGNSPEWFVGDLQVGIGRHPAEHIEAAFQGIHSEYPLIIIDEASGISKSLFDAVDGLATNENARVLAIGNPDDPNSQFARICQPDSGWHVIGIDGLRTPNMNAMQIAKWPYLSALMRATGLQPNPKIPPAIQATTLLSPRWVEERIIRWAGVAPDAKDKMTPDELAEYVLEKTNSSQLFVAKVRGRFPADTEMNTAVIPLGWVMAAFNRWREWEVNGKPRALGRRYVGVDVARGGGDKSALAVRHGMVVEQLQTLDVADTMIVADRANEYMSTPGAIAVVDVIGVGAGVLDAMRRAREEGKTHGDAIAFNASAQSNRQDVLREFKFKNDRSAAWWNLRELLDPSRGSTLALPPDDDLLEELTTPNYQIRDGGTIQVESKEKIKQRLGRSTDSADAVIQSLWLTDDAVDFEVWQGEIDPTVNEYAASWAGEGW